MLAADEDGSILLQAAELRRRQAGIDALHKIVENPDSSEWDIHAELSKQLWIFGGKFIDEAPHRRLVPGDEVDIPLLRPDGSLHIVELKRANVHVVKPYRGAHMPTDHVHSGISQAANYLVGLDENRERILAEFEIDSRRASAMLLVGHPKHQPDVDEQLINEVLRTHNAHLSRIEVLTYKELLDAAERSLKP
ncbi:DUF4263 domain-containing protein [Pseudonocardiaceae bacterium YIM PH 21723]|nr:DUF4263 domain-containing protein [Pseudonocardiaceae bacterium YIM PH 21723]